MAQVTINGLDPNLSDTRGGRRTLRATATGLKPAGKAARVLASPTGFAVATYFALVEADGSSIGFLSVPTIQGGTTPIATYTVTLYRLLSGDKDVNGGTGLPVPAAIASQLADFEQSSWSGESYSATVTL